MENTDDIGAEDPARCVSCGEPDHDDSLTSDGLCFTCDVEDTCTLIGPEHVAGFLDQLAAHEARRQVCFGQTPGVN